MDRNEPVNIAEQLTKNMIDVLETMEESTEERKARLELEAEIQREHEARMRAIAMVYETADRIITADPVGVRLVEDASMPSAWSDGKTISLNTKVLQNYSDKDIMSLHGVNYHEVCHILYTPRMGSEFVQWLVEANLMQAFNVLEDQRIETLFVARFPSTRVFLEAAVLRYVLEVAAGDEYAKYPSLRDRDLRMSFLLTHGRRYLNKGFRDMIRSRFEKSYRGPELIPALTRIVDEYRVLSFPKDYAAAKSLIMELDKIMKDNHMDVPVGPCGSRDPMKKGRPEAGSDQSKDAEKARNDAENSQGMPEKSEGEGESGEGAANDETDESASATPNAEFAQEHKDLADAINTLLDEMSQDKTVRSETKEFRQAVRTNERATNSLRKHKYLDVSVETDIISSARNFGDELRELQQEADPTWLREKPHGKLNIQRAMHADINDYDKLFDQWYEGDDVCDIEAAILLDCSGSMQYRMDAANAATWSIKRGLERIGSRVTVYTFSEISRLLYSADEKAAPSSARVVSAGGGTDPARALDEAEYIMSVSSKATKIVFVVTDGMWNWGTTSDATIKRMNADGVVTVVVHIGSLKYYEDMLKDPSMAREAKKQLDNFRHNAQIMRSISHPRELGPLAKHIVTTYIKERIYR